MASSHPHGDPVREALTRLSNRGRWGANDRLGTLNFLTPDATRAAATSVRHGLTISCGRPLVPRAAGTNPPHYMHLMVDVPDPATEGEGVAGDWVGINFHGHQVTHLDAHGHVFVDGESYNGLPAASLSARIGAPDGNVQEAAGRIAGRGVLLDVAALDSRGWADPDRLIGAADLRECLSRANLQLAPGDIVLVRSGRDAPGRPPDAPMAGLDLDTLDVLAEAQTAVLGSDAFSDAGNSFYPPWVVPVHAVAIAGMGLWLIDNVWMEDLAAACRTHEQWHFFFVATPLKLKNATGSPVDPIAIL